MKGEKEKRNQFLAGILIDPGGKKNMRPIYNSDAVVDDGNGRH